MLPAQVSNFFYHYALSCAITFVLRKSGAKKIVAASFAVSHNASAIPEIIPYGIFSGDSR